MVNRLNFIRHNTGKPSQDECTAHTKVRLLLFRPLVLVGVLVRVNADLVAFPSNQVIYQLWKNTVNRHILFRSKAAVVDVIEEQYHHPIDGSVVLQLQLVGLLVGCNNVETS